MHGIKEFKEFLQFILRLVTLADSILPGGIKPEEYLLIGSLLPGAITGITGIKQIPQELADLDVSELNELKNVVIQELDLRDDDKERKAEGILIEALTIFLSIQNIRELFPGKEAA